MHWFWSANLGSPGSAPEARTMPAELAKTRKQHPAMVLRSPRRRADALVQRLPQQLRRLAEVRGKFPAVRSATTRGRSHLPFTSPSIGPWSCPRTPVSDPAEGSSVTGDQPSWSGVPQDLGRLRSPISVTNLQIGELRPRVCRFRLVTSALGVSPLMRRR
jgi:hypothetical protein